ncbi:4817_t:CDS:2 [Funneliformis caledonium]|uniref:4817_t:CDS:1 n=1 Tax=Funneliformis caledonium TaxID=1117310 RepID=A0A9N9E2R7_9GLOM|nr:4817_t:CDS:2 [Funneliformis caledonium]
MTTTLRSRTYLSFVSPNVEVVYDDWQSSLKALVKSGTKQNPGSMHGFYAELLEIDGTFEGTVILENCKKISMISILTYRSPKKPTISGEVGNIHRNNQKNLSKLPEDRRQIGWYHDGILTVNINGVEEYIGILEVVGNAIVEDVLVMRSNSNTISRRLES